ncbi:MAG: C-terminal binding protein [Syntrophaceae bacterium]|nr:C-terminal binding protein [Syntrophaceae bacterium]
MRFKIALILDDETDFSHLENSLKKMEAEFWRKHCKTEQEVIAAAQEADFIITITHRYPYTRRVLEALKKCRYIETLGAGHDGVDLEACAELGIGVISNTDYHKEEVSDHAMALLLACSRQIVRLDHQVKKGKNGIAPGGKSEIQEAWPGMTRLRGKNLGLIGLGRIARSVASKAKGFGMKIAAYDPYLSAEMIHELGVEKCGLEELLREADFLSIHAVLSSGTRHLIKLEHFRMMKRSTFLINTSRGEIVDPAALLTALTEGSLAGAALDVTDPDPLPPDSPLLKLGNIILTGHSAHYSPENWLTKLERPAEEITRIMRKEWPLGLINPEMKEKHIQKWGAYRA